MKNIALIIISILMVINIFAEDWYKIEGKFSTVEYQQSNADIGDSLLEIAELSIPRLAKIFDVPLPDLMSSKVRIILTGAPDVSNGYALGDAVVIYALSSMYMDMTTGTQTWYAYVLKHELAHYMTFIKTERRLNFLGQLATITIPRWFYEGAAQYYTENWNTYRGDIYVRNAVLNGELNYSALNDLSDGRLLYAAAHGFTRFLADRYGDSCLVKLMAHNADGWLYDFDAAFNDIYEKSPESAFKEYIRHMVLYYGDMLAEYPVTDIPEDLISYGYDTQQVMPVSLKDSTFLVTAQVNKIHNYYTLLIVHYEEEKIQSVQQISNRVDTKVFLSEDKTMAAYGRFYLGYQSNQISLKYQWQIYNLESGKKITIKEKLRSREAAFDQNNNLILSEIKADHSTLYRFNIKDENLEKVYRSSMTIGGLTCLPDNRLIIAAQRDNGYRDLFLLSDSALSALTNDPEDDRLPAAVNDSIIIFNRYIDNNPALASYNLNTPRMRIILNDQYAYRLEGFDNASQKLIVSTWYPPEQNAFALLSVDSIEQLPAPPDTITKKEKYASWTTKKPQAARLIGLPDTTLKDLTRQSVFLPQSDLIHLLSFGLPLYDSDLGFGLYGITAWIEALQRQAFSATFIVYQKDINKSLAVLAHSFMAMNSMFTTAYYHGPVIFSHQNGDYIEIYQDIGDFNWSKNYFINGSQRLTLTPALSYTGYYYQLEEPVTDEPNTFGYHGPAVQMRLNYLLPTDLYPFIPKRQFSFSAKYFKSLNRQYDFGISEINLTLASNLWFESLGFKTELAAINKHGKLPALKTLGVDRYYAYDFPRDFKYTRPVRGVRKDLSSDQLYWSSSALSLYLADRTGMALLFLPVNNLGISGFLDYAQLGDGKENRVYGYGAEISFGESIYRLALGQAEGNYAGASTGKEWYIRLSLFAP